MKRLLCVFALSLSISCAFPPLFADDISPSSLQERFDKSDLVIIATPLETSGGGMGETVGQPGRMVDFTDLTPLLKIDRIVKSTGFSGKTLRIRFTMRRFVGNWPPAPSDRRQKFSFRLADNARDDKGLPGSPTKGIQYVFFLEDAKKRHPESHYGVGADELFYWGNDYDLGMAQAMPQILAKLDKISVAQ